MNLPSFNNNSSYVMEQQVDDEGQNISRPDWKYEENPHQASGTAIKIVNEAFRNKKDLRFIDDQNTSPNIKIKSEAIFRYASDLTFDRNKSGQQIIYQRWPLENDKYIEYDCESENSEDDEIEFDFPICDDIMSIIETQRQDGKMYFVTKMIAPLNQEFKIQVQRIKGGGNDPVTVEILEKRDPYYLFKMSMTSQVRIFKLKLMLGNQVIRESRPYSFDVERLEYNPGLSYDFVNNKQLSMSLFQGVIATSCFNIVDSIEFFEKSIKKLEEKSKNYLNEDIQFDELFERYLTSQKNLEKWLLQFQIILSSPQKIDDKINFYRNPTIQKIGNYFMKFMIRHQLKINDQRRITAKVAQKLIETYLQIFTIQKVRRQNFNLLKEIESVDLNKKTCVFIEFLIQQKKFDIVYRYMVLEIDFELNVLHKLKGLDSFIEIIQDSIDTYDESYVDLVTIFIFYFVKFTNVKSTQLIKIIKKCFDQKIYDWNNRPNAEQKNGLSEVQSRTTQYLTQIASFVAAQNLFDFQSLFNLVNTNKSHKYLDPLFRNQNLLENIERFSDTLIRDVEKIKQQEQLRKTVQILVDYCFNNLHQRITKLRTLNDKVLKTTIPCKNHQIQCQFAHKLILNPLLKNFTPSYAETIKNIEKQISKLITNKMNNFNQTSSLVNKCFDVSIISLPETDEIYKKFFLDEIYKRHFVKENAEDFENLRSDYKNWHNQFGYHYVINSFILQNVVKISFEKQKQPRRRQKIIKFLKNQIDKGICSHSEKENLKYIVELDNIELTEQFILKILSDQRDKLFVLKKIQDDKNQQIILESLMADLALKLKNQQKPGKVYMKIAQATGSEKNLIEKVFGNIGITQMIEEKSDMLKECFDKLGRIRSFIEILNAKYEIQGYNDLVQKLRITQIDTKEKQLKFKDEIINIISMVDEKILKCYSFSSFFAEQMEKNITLSQAVERCQYLQKRIIEMRNLVIEQFNEKQLTYGSVSFFKEELSREKQLKELFLMDVNGDQMNEDNSQLIRQLLAIFSLIKKVPNLSKVTKGLIHFITLDQTGKLTNLRAKLINISSYLVSIQAGQQNTNISKLSQRYNELSTIIQSFKLSKSQKLSLQKSIDLLQFFSELSTVEQSNFQQILKIKSELNNLKEKCEQDEDSFEVDFDDLQKAEAIIKYIEEVYNQHRTNFKQLIMRTSEMMKTCPYLRQSHKVFKKLDELTKQFENVNKGDSKNVQKINAILKICEVSINFNQGINPKISLSIDETKKIIENSKIIEIMEKNNISEDEIKNLKNYVILYIVQNSEKQKTQEEVRKTIQFEKFLKLLRNIDDLKSIWSQLQGWGYIVFKNKGISRQNKKIVIQQGNCQHLNDYIKNYKEICDNWIKEVQELQKISPKTTLLQGQSFGQFYEVLTNKSPQKKIRFLNICQIMILETYIRENKIKYVEDPLGALNTIKQFFQSLKKDDKAQVQPLPDWGESYIKAVFMSETDNDFIKGIIEIDVSRIKNLDMTKILVCVQDTTQLDIKGFIETALNDETSEYVIIRPQKLSNKHQQFIIKKIQQHKKINPKISLKLCLVSNSEIQALYQYLKSNFVRKQSTLYKQVKQKQYRDFICQKSKNIAIVKSRRAGYGKTSWIIQKSNEQNRKCIFFPLAGAPTYEYIYKRFEQACQNIYKTYRDQKRLCSFVVQFHNIDPEKFKTINTFLFELITGRCVKYEGKFPQILQQTSIFIELENIQSINKFDPLVTFTFLKEITSINQGLVYNIEERPALNFKFCDEKKMQYIIQHLDYLQNNLLDKDQGDLKNLKPFSQFKSSQLNVEKTNQLMKKYFFDFLPKATFYQFQYFCSLLFSVCNTFSSSFGLSFFNIQTSFDKLSFQRLELSTIRSGFFKVVLGNCRQFIEREISYKQFQYKNASETQKKLKQIPFLIIPDTDGQSFSFIYKDHKSVPAAVRNFYISQQTQLRKDIFKGNLEEIFEKHSIKKLQEDNSQLFDQKIEQVLCNISGKRNYKITKDPNYVVNIDNFFKMCLITLRQRENIPITIMGEAGTGKTAILKHVSEQLFEHQFMTLNVNAGTKVQDLRKFITQVEKKYNELKGEKKIWVFFDQFNTLKEVGYMKEIIIDKRFEGKQLPFLKDIVIMAACNPFRKIKPSVENQAEAQMIPNGENQNEQGNLAFHVLPPPHSMIQCMWNYGALSSYEYEKYISKMILNVEYKNSLATKLLLDIHQYLDDTFGSSYVSLRDVERFRTIYEFFNSKLPMNAHKNTATYIGYDNRSERALIMTFIFCYTLRIESDTIKRRLYSMIEGGLNLPLNFVTLVKGVEETDFFHRLRIDYGSIAANSAIKENIYCFFVAIYNKLPMIIVGPPGCSKSLAIRILTENMKGYNSEDKYLRQFQSIRSINFQGSELCTSKQVQSLFAKAIKVKDNQVASLKVIVFDEIGLADKSKQNPLKVIHPYLEVSRELNLKNQQKNQRNYAFLGISNTNLDISKMSRMLVLRRPQPSDQQLKNTAIGIAESFEYGKNQKILNIIKSISEAFFKFIQQWHKLKNFKNFFSLRDFYSLIKYFLKLCQEKQVNINQDQEITSLLEEAIFKNLNGNDCSVELFMKNYCEVTRKGYNEGEVMRKFDVVENMIKCLQNENLRFPLVLAKDKQSLSYLINLFVNRFKKTTYFEKSPFPDDSQNAEYIIQSTASIIKTVGNGDKLILNNIEPTIQTSLYDMLNKFYIVRGDKNYCRISEVNSGMTKKTLVHENFNCIFFLLSDNLLNVEAPFLSRFEKYSFSMEKISHFKKVENFVKQVEIFKQNIIDVCKNQNMSHYTIDRFFQNCDKDSLKTLILRVINESNLPMTYERAEEEEQYKKTILDEVIFELIMNSTQDFIMLYQFVLQKEMQLSVYSKSIKRAIERKKNFRVQEASETILFTTDKNVVYSSCEKQKQQTIRKLDLQLVKNQKSFDIFIKDFLNSKEQRIIFIQLQKNSFDSIQYLISEVQKIKLQQQIANNATYADKRIIFFIELDRQLNNKQTKPKGISYLSQYRQVFYEGKLQIEAIKYQRNQFFNNILDLTTILTHLQQFFTVEIKSSNQDNNSSILRRFKGLYNELKTDKTNALHRHLEEFIERTQGINVSIQESMIKEILQNPQFLKNSKNFKQALTRQISSKSYYGVVSFFLKHLFEIDSFLTYSRKEIHNLNAIESLKLKGKTIQFIQNAKQSQVYENSLRLLTNKKIDFLIQQYKKMKNIKRLPSAERKFVAEIGRGRFVHFSKSENEMILSKESGSLSSLALGIFGKETNFQKQLKVFRQQLHKMSRLVIKGEVENKGENLYDSINKENSIKQLFVLQLLTDLAEKRGVDIQHIEIYMKIFKMLVSFESTSQHKTLDLEYIIFVILVLEQHLIFAFKLFAVFYDKQIFLSMDEKFFERHRIRQIRSINQHVCNLFFESLIRDIFTPLLKNSASIQKFGGPKKYFEIFTNSMLQIENLQKVLKQDKQISPILISIRDISRFVSEFSEQHKYQLLEEFIKKLNQQKTKPNIYSITFNFIEKLYHQSKTNEQKTLILKFQANKIFLQWFKDRPDDKDCLENFILKCEDDKNFCQNSMHVINYLLNSSDINYEDITKIEESFKEAQKQLHQIAKFSKKIGFQNNLCILMVNIFFQKLIKLNSGKSHQEIVSENKQFLSAIYKSLSLNNISLSLYQIFLFAFTKFVVNSYAQGFLTNQIDNDISILLNTDSDLSTNLRLFCLKIFRKYLTPREIKDKFIKIKKMHWSTKIENDFQQDNARSLIVPKDFCNNELANIFNQIEKSDGSAFNLFEAMLEYAKGFQNRYSILNFFMRYYYTFSYNDKVYKEKTIQHFQSIKGKFEQRLGKVETELISRYLNNNVSLHYKSIDAATVNEEDIIVLNFFNLFLASKKSLSPLHSMFVQNGQLSTNTENIMKQQFSLSGPDNPFIANAINTINLTRNNNIGVYICCSDCDYIYTHQDCGWPKQQSDCPMCGQKIGRKNASHSLSRDDQGARRIMNKAFVDKSAFYVWNMKELQQYWQVQRKYIDTEIYRMKLKKSYTIKLRKQTVNLTGFQVVDSGRISTFSFNILSTLLETLSYFLISLNVIDQNQAKNMFGDNTSQLAMNRLSLSIKQTINTIKSSLNIGNKFGGWMFGIQRSFIEDMNDFPSKFREHQKSLVDDIEKLKINLNMRIAEKKIRQDYINLYIEFIKTIEEGYFIRQICAIEDYTGANQFTRDYAQKLFEKLVSLNTNQQKFEFSMRYQTLQGKMQFPFDVFLTQDKIDENKYNYYKIFKLPDQEIGYHDIVVKYEAFIKEKYPFLDYILKQSDLFIQMKNFYNVISYVNELHKEVSNRYERTKAEEPLIDFINELQQEKGHSLNKKLREPKVMIQSWKKLSGFLGNLQNQCKPVGKMNDDYNENTELKAFLLDQSTKQNVYGLMIASIFHNFAKMHNQSMTVLNSRKNQIKSYASLNLFNELQKLHPQKIEIEQIYILDEEQLKKSLEQCSVASITYGQNYVYHNFDAYEEYFLKKLQGKCEIISNLRQYVSVCYNGEAFSAQNEGSAVLAEIREVLSQKLSSQNHKKVSQFIRRQKGSEHFEKSVVQVRGDLQKIMLVLNTLKGNYQKEKSFSQIINEIEISITSQQLKNGQLSQIAVCQIVDLYQILEDELMYNVVKKLPNKYKEKFQSGIGEEVEECLQNLPKEQNEEKPTVKQLESAVMKFTSRTLQNGIFDQDKNLIQFVTTRADFWPKGYSDDKIQTLTYEPALLKIKICHTMALIELMQKIKANS